MFKSKEYLFGFLAGIVSAAALAFLFFQSQQPPPAA